MRRVLALLDSLLLAVLVAAILTMVFSRIIVVISWSLPECWHRLVALSPLIATVWIPVGAPRVLGCNGRRRMPRSRVLLVVLTAGFLSRTLGALPNVVIDTALGMIFGFSGGLLAPTCSVVSCAIVFVATWAGCAAMDLRIRTQQESAAAHVTAPLASRHAERWGAALGASLAWASWAAWGSSIPAPSMVRKVVPVASAGVVEVQSIHHMLDEYVCSARLLRGGHEGPWTSSSCSPDSGPGAEYRVIDLDDCALIEFADGLVRVALHDAERVDAMSIDEQTSLLVQLVRSRDCALVPRWAHRLAYQPSPEACRVLRSAAEALGARGSGAPLECDAAARIVYPGISRCGP